MHVISEFTTCRGSAWPELRLTLESSTFRTLLQRCCPEIGNETAIQLLRRLRAEVKALEICSGMPSELYDPHSDFGSWDPVLDDAINAKAFPNQWTNCLMHNDTNLKNAWRHTSEKKKKKKAREGQQRAQAAKTRPKRPTQKAQEA